MHSNNPAPAALIRLPIINTRALGRLSENPPTHGASTAKATRNTLCKAGTYQLASCVDCITIAITVNKIALSANADKNCAMSYG
ncbi:MAG: hypothetical protein ACXV8I_05115 [Methylobacter sp.]